MLLYRVFPVIDNCSTVRKNKQSLKQLYKQLIISYEDSENMFSRQN